MDKRKAVEELRKILPSLNTDNERVKQTLFKILPAIFFYFHKTTSSQSVLNLIDEILSKKNMDDVQ